MSDESEQVAKNKPEESHGDERALTPPSDHGNGSAIATSDTEIASHDFASVEYVAGETIEDCVLFQDIDDILNPVDSLPENDDASTPTGVQPSGLVGWEDFLNYHYDIDTALWWNDFYDDAFGIHMEAGLNGVFGEEVD